MSLKQTFEHNLHALMDLKVPLDHNGFSGVDIFVQALDRAEKLAVEILQKKTDATNLSNEVKRLQTELTQLFQGLETKIKPYETGITNIKKAMEHDKNSNGLTACTGMGVAFNQIEGFIKGNRTKSLTLKIDVTGG